MRAAKFIGPRFFSEAAALKSSEPRALQISRLPTGLTLASFDNDRPVSQIIFGFKAGSRFESHDQHGLTHRFRNCFGLGTHNSSAIHLLEFLSRYGASISCTTTKDFMLYKMTVARDFVPWALEAFGEAVYNPAFKAWELDDTEEIMELEYKQFEENRSAKMMELVHEAAYRNGPLANHLHGKKFKINPRSVKILEQFADTHLVTGNSILIGLNVDSDHLNKYLEYHCDLKEGPVPTVTPSPYRGGIEIRQKEDGNLTRVAMVGEGASLQDFKGLAVQSVLGAILGIGPRIPYTASMGQSLVAQATHGVSEGLPFGLSAFSCAHLDTGLFGYQIIAEGSKMGSVLPTAQDAVKNLGENLTEKMMERGRNMAKLDTLVRSENSVDLSEDMAIQLLATGGFKTPSETLAQIDQVTLQDVKQFLQRIFSHRGSMVAMGKLDSTPFMDELLK